MDEMRARHIDRVAAQLTTALYAGYEDVSEEGIFKAWQRFRERVGKAVADDRVANSEVSAMMERNGLPPLDDPSWDTPVHRRNARA